MAGDALGVGEQLGRVQRAVAEDDVCTGALEGEQGVFELLLDSTKVSVSILSLNGMVTQITDHIRLIFQN